MFTKKIITVICFAMLVSIGFIACKKDAFSEKDAIAAQTALLQTKFDNERSLEQLRQSGATALAQLNFQLTLQINSRNNIQQDSIQRAYNRFVDSAALAQRRSSDSLTLTNAKRVDIIISVRDIINQANPVAGATVLLPTSVGTALTATTDANGIAIFPAANNVNVPATVQAIVSRTGYATALSGFITRTVNGIGQTTVQLWNNGNLRNTVTGTVNIDANLTNQAMENVAGQLITITNTFNNSTNFFTALTNANGVYSIMLPDANGSTISGFNFLPVTKDSTHTLWVNSLLPGTDSIPSVVTIPARYTLQSYISNTGGFGAKPTAPSGSVVSNINRFHGVIDTRDSLNRTFYFKNLNLQNQGNDPLTQQNSFIVAGNFSPQTAPTFDGNNNILTNASFQGRFTLAQTTFAGTNLSVRFVDLMNNSDNLFNRLPSIQTSISWSQLALSNIPGFGSFSSLNIATSPTNPTLTFLNIFPTRSAATGNLNGYLPTASALVPSNRTMSGIMTVNRVYVNAAPGNTPPFIGTISGGTTTTINLTFGVGALTQGVR